MRFFALLSLLVISCSQPSPDLRIVEKASYVSDRKCWFDANGQFTAFVILNPEKAGHRPTFISKFCIVDGAGSGAEYIFDIPSYPFAGQGLAMRRDEDVPLSILNNLEAHANYFSENQTIYDISAEMILNKESESFELNSIAKLRERKDLSISQLPYW